MNAGKRLAAILYLLFTAFLPVRSLANRDFSCLRYEQAPGAPNGGIANFSGFGAG